MEAENAEQAFHVRDHVLATRIFCELLDSIIKVETCHIVRVSLSHLNEVDLELLIELLPSGNSLVLRVRESLQVFGDSY